MPCCGVLSCCYAVLLLCCDVLCCAVLCCHVLAFNIDIQGFAVKLVPYHRLGVIARAGAGVERGSRAGSAEGFAVKPVSVCFETVFG